jgi:hypothetical protein
LNYGFEWGYSTLKSGLSLLEVYKSGSDLDKIEAAMNLITGADFGPQAALASGYVTFLFDFIRSYDQKLSDSWSNMYFGFYQWAKQNNQISTFFIEENGLFLPREGTSFYNLMNGLNDDGSSINYTSHSFEHIVFEYDEIEFLIRGMLDPYAKNMSTRNLEDSIKEGAGLIAFYENRPDVKKEDVQSALNTVAVSINKYETDDLLFQYFEKASINNIYLQSLSQKNIIDFYLNDTTLWDEKTTPSDTLEYKQILDLNLSDFSSNTVNNSYVYFTAQGLSFKRKLTDFYRSEVA